MAATAGITGTVGGFASLIGNTGTAGAVGMEGVAEAELAMGADFLVSGGIAGMLRMTGSVAAGTPVSMLERFCGGGSAGALDVEAAAGAVKMGADFFCGGGRGGALGVAAEAGGIKIWADFFCGGGRGGALGVEAAAGGAKIGADFFCGAGKGGALGVAEAGAAAPLIEEVFRCGGGKGGALEVTAAGGVGATKIGADFLCSGWGGAPARGSAPVLGRGGGKGGVRLEVFVLDGELVRLGSAPVFGFGGGKGGAGRMPVLGRGKGAGSSAAGAEGGVAAAGAFSAGGGGVAAGRSLRRREEVRRRICVGTFGRSGEARSPAPSVGFGVAGGKGVVGAFAIAGADGIGGGLTFAAAGIGGAATAGTAGGRETPVSGWVTGSAGGRLEWEIGVKSSSSPAVLPGRKTFAFGFAMKTRGGGAAGAAGSAFAGALETKLVPMLGAVDRGGCGKRGVVFAAATGGLESEPGGAMEPGSVPVGGRLRLPIGFVTAVDHAGGTLWTGAGVMLGVVPSGKVVAPETLGRAVNGAEGLAGRGGRLMRSVSRLGFWEVGSPG